jgi:hypothetical protein
MTLTNRKDYSMVRVRKYKNNKGLTATISNIYGSENSLVVIRKDSIIPNECFQSVKNNLTPTQAANILKELQMVLIGTQCYNKETEQESINEAELLAESQFKLI